MSYSNINVGKNAEDYEVSEVFDTYGRVDITLGEDDEGNVITVSYPNIPDDQVGGRILTVDMPMCTDTTLALNAATRIYNSLMTKDPTAFQYQPMKSKNALLDPSAEFGDSVDINGVHSGFHTRDVDFSALMNADITSPTDEELNHEYPFQDSQQRQITRSAKEYKSGLYVNAQAISAEVSARTLQGQQFESQLSVQATDIKAKVSKQSPTGQTTFGWNLSDSEWTVFSGNTNNTILRASSSGLEVTGKITATSGQIGGFTIGSSSIYSNGMSSMSSTQTTGVHLGTDGIKLGKNFKVDTYGKVTASDLAISGGSISIGTKFSVDKYGNVTANDMTLKGNLTVGSSTITADSLRQGAESGYSWANTEYGNSGLSYANYAIGGAGDGYSAKGTWDTATNPWGYGIGYMKAQTLVVTNAMTIGAHGVGAYLATINGVNIPYFGWGQPY